MILHIWQLIIISIENCKIHYLQHLQCETLLQKKKYCFHKENNFKVATTSISKAGHKTAATNMEIHLNNRNNWTHQSCNQKK